MGSESLEFGGGCRCDGGQPKNFLRPCVLLLLSEQGAHGYELLDRLREFRFARDPGGLYRVLRSLEREGLVTSRWEPSDVGPDRCLYHLSPLGSEWLHAWADTLDETRRTLELYRHRYTTGAGRARHLADAVKAALESSTAVREEPDMRPLPMAKPSPSAAGR